MKAGGEGENFLQAKIPAMRKYKFTRTHQISPLKEPVFGINSDTLNIHVHVP